MGTLLPEKICADRKRAIEELIKGRARDMAAQLQDLFGKPTGDPHGPEELVEKLLTSFTESLSVLTSICGDCEVCQIPVTTQVGSPSSGDGRSVETGESSKRPAAKDRRGCYKRRNTSEIRVEVSTTSADDHGWRKYGQKDILNAQFPRCYFRCTHKHDQSCQATKQVQRIQEAPHMYRTTYFGHHTCRSHPLNNPSQNPLLHSDPLEPYLHHFGSKTITTEKEHNHHQYPSCPSSVLSVKKECGEETVQSNTLSGDLPATEPIVWPELMPLEYSSSGYSTASTSTSQGFDMDLFLGSGDFGSYFLDENDFLLSSEGSDQSRSHNPL